MIKEEELKKLQDRIGELEQKLEFSSQMLNDVNDLIYRYEFLPKQRFRYVSPSSTKITGYTPEEHYEDPDLGMKLIHPDDLPVLHQAISRPQEAANQTILRWIRKDGAVIWTAHTLKTHFNKNGDLAAINGVARDITEQKIREKESQKFKAILDNSFYGNAITDLQGNIIYLNKYFAEIHGYSADELIGKNLSIFHRDDQLPRVMKLNQKLIKEGGYENQEVWHVHKDGTRFPMLMTGLVVNDEDGKPKYLAASAVDITERKNSERTLIENEQRYRLLHEHSGLRVGYYKPDGTVISFNEKAAATMGGKPSEFVGKSIFDLFSKDQAEEYMCRLKKAIESGNADAYEDYLEIGGKLYWFRSTYASIKNENDETIGVQIISEDITEKKEQNENLKESENRFRNIFENHDAVMLLIDPENGKIENANASAESFYGYTKEEFLKLTIFDINQTGRSEVKKNIDQALLKKSNKFHFNHLMKDGLAKNVEVHSTPIKIDDKTHLFSIINDITEQKKSQKIQGVLYEISKFSSTNYNLRDFLEKVHQKISTILYAKNLFVALYHKLDDKYTFPYFVDETENYESNELMPLKGSLTDFVRRTGKGQLINHLNEAELSKNNEIKLIGSECPIWLGAPLINSSNNEVIGVLAIQDYYNKDAYAAKDLEILEIIAYNIGMFIERIQKSEALKLAKVRAEESDRLKSAFLANMSHEIRTPMSGIMGFTELLQEPNLTGKEQERYIDVIQKSGERMLSTVNDIIDISKIDSGQMEVRLDDVNVSKELEALFVFFKTEADAKGLHFNLSNKIGNENTVIRTDKTKLNSILTNLIKNAIKYTDSGSIELGCSKHDSHFNCYVKDTGIGISENRLKAVFNRFEQADISDQRAFEGSGLGLSIAKSYVEMLGGKLWVESTENTGSTFYFTLPWKNTEAEGGKSVAQAEENMEMAETSKPRIMVAEDDEISQQHLNIILNDFTSEIIHVETGTKAVETIKSNPEIDLILMDIKMPGMNGYDATREIRKFNKDVVIIAQTAYALAGDREKALEAGCNDYLAKPIKKKELITIIQKYFK